MAARISERKIRKVLAKYDLKENEVEISPLGIYQPENSAEKSVSVHLEFRAKLDDKKLSKIMDDLEKI